MEKVSMYKFTHIPLLKNDDQLKQINDKQPKKKKKNKQTNKKKKKATPRKSPPTPKKKKKKKKVEEEGNAQPSIGKEKREATSLRQCTKREKGIGCIWSFLSIK